MQLQSVVPLMQTGMQANRSLRAVPSRQTNTTGLSSPTSFSCGCCVPISTGFSAIGLGFIGSIFAGATCAIIALHDKFKTHVESLFKQVIK